MGTFALYSLADSCSFAMSRRAWLTSAGNWCSSWVMQRGGGEGGGGVEGKWKRAREKRKIGRGKEDGRRGEKREGRDGERSVRGRANKYEEQGE